MMSSFYQFGDVKKMDKGILMAAKLSSTPDWDTIALVEAFLPTLKKT